MKNQMEIPADGFKGLVKHIGTDALSGFMVSLLALPLSLGIAKASGFPPLLGLVTAIIGGVIVSLFMGCRLSIKGPAAGLITIATGATVALGSGVLNDKGIDVMGWQMTCGAIVVAAVFQILFGVFKLGKFSDFFPLSVIHGMLAAIGLIIFAKQIHFIFGINPASIKKMGPFELFAEIPNSLINNLNTEIFIIGMACLVIVFGWPMIKSKITKKIPAPLIVLAVSIPLGIVFHLDNKVTPNALVSVGNIFDIVDYNARFDKFATWTFALVVIQYLLIGSIESLLTVKAVDIMDPWKRKSDTNKDLIATGVGNVGAGLLGGLPMISEVARSTANVAYGAKTRWSNFFHGISLLIFVLVATPLINMIPSAALAALLIGVGYRLASPKEFKHTFKIGVEQLIIFLTTIFFTLYEDLLWGVGAGIMVKFIIHFINGLPVKYVFKSKFNVEDDGSRYILYVHKAAVFSNLLGIKKKLYKIPDGKKIFIDLSDCRIVDHSAMDNFYKFQEEYQAKGGECKIYGLDRHKAISKHKSSAYIMPRHLRRELKDGDAATSSYRDDNTNHEHRIN
jgi:MFS superfamily sulfate permease-like transporter